MTKLSAERRDEILSRLVRERAVLKRMKTQRDATKADLKDQDDEMKARLSQILMLCDELDGGEQICKSCGLVREIGEARWTMDTACPDCTEAAEMTS